MPARRPPTAHPDPILREALDAARPGIADIAEAIGVPTSTLMAYHAGIRTPPQDVRDKVARYLRKQGKRLTTLADRLSPE